MKNRQFLKSSFNQKISTEENGSREKVKKNIVWMAEHDLE